ncbi:hypothetical protein G7Z17_g3082 [Cylindrodendrum hubeiense]|uniref:DUF6594 domain-containing protein n=1 Tax=Cylindrodendrum hubeiense TaxID=595255 RepID=A0A9P5LB40_9HYPO|nr:hypothetical protein G7Z17_g3082 [Cylindrodendrum hubeiense]
MQVNMLRTAPACRGSGSSTGDLADQRIEQDIPLEHHEDSGPPCPDLEAHGSQEGDDFFPVASVLGMLIDVEAPLRGLILVASHRRDDVMYQLARRFREQAAFCLDTRANYIHQSWRKVVQTIDRDGNGLDKLQKDFFRDLKEYYEFVMLTYQVEGLVKADRLLLKHFIGTVKPDLREDDASFLEGPREDWVEAYPMETMNRWLKLIPEHSTVRSLCNKFRNRDKITTHEHFEAHEYSDEVFMAVFITISHIIIVTLVGAPVIIQALGILPMAWNAVMYMVCLILFIIFTQAIVRSESTQFLMSLAFAAVVATNLGRAH